MLWQNQLSPMILGWRRMRSATVTLLVLARSASSLRVAPTTRRLATRTRASADPYAGADQRPVVLYLSGVF